MTEDGDTITFRLRVRRDRRTGAWWLAAPLAIGDRVTLWMVPNTVALGSVITPPAWAFLRAESLVGADIVDLRTGRQTGVLGNFRLGWYDVPDFAVRVRDIEGLQLDGGRYAVDGYLGLGFFLEHFAAVTLDTQRLEVTLRLKA